MEEQIICPNCKCMNSNKSLVCEHCGTLLKPNTVETQVPSTESAQIEQLDKNVNMTVNSEQLNQQNNDMLETEAVVPSTEVVNTPISSMNPDILNAQVIPVVAGVQTTEPQSGPYPSLNINQETQVSINQFTNKKSNGLVIKKVFIVVASIVVLALFSPLFSNYFSSSDRSGKRNESSSTSSNKDKIKDENGEEHTIGGKSKHYNDSLEDKVKYLLNSKPLDNIYNYSYINDIHHDINLLYYNNGIKIPINKSSAKIFDKFVATQIVYTVNIYDRYGELVSEGEFYGYDEFNDIFRSKDDKYYNINGQIGKEYSLSAINLSDYSLLMSTTKDKYTIINSNSKVVYENDRNLNPSFDLDYSIGSKYFVVNEGSGINKKNKIVSKDTGKIIYETSNDLDFVKGNLFEEQLYNYTHNYIFVQKEQVLFQTKSEPYASEYIVKNGSNIYSQETGDRLPSKIWYGMGRNSYHAYKEDGYVITTCSNIDDPKIKFGLEVSNMTILDCKYEGIDFFYPTIYDELKSNNKRYAIVIDGGIISVFDLVSKKMVYEKIIQKNKNRFIYIGDAAYNSSNPTESKLINIITGKEYKFIGGIDLGENYTMGYDVNGQTYYSNDFQTIYFQKEDRNH